MKLLEKKLKYKFNNPHLLETALTHSSYARGQHEGKEYNERLEFLGDAFFDAIIGEELYLMFPEKEEGSLSRIRAALVCEASLAREARKLKLGEYLKLGRGEEKTGGRERPSILADSMEAIIGAVYLDGGFEAVKRVVLEIFHDAIEDARNGKFIITDYKTAAQEWLQGRGISDIKYVLLGESGPAHNKTFIVAMHIQGKPVSEGVGKSKKQAEQRAAEEALRRYNVI